MAATDRPISNSITYTENGDAIYPAGPVYSACAVGITSPSPATDVFTISGSATKNVRVHNIIFTGTLGTAAARDVLLIKRSTANSGGTAAVSTNIPLDSNYAAASAVVRSYTVNPTLGNAVGTLRVRRIGVPTAAATALDVADFEFMVPSTLRGVAQSLCVSLNNVANAVVWSCYVEWSED